MEEIYFTRILHLIHRRAVPLPLEGEGFALYVRKTSSPWFRRFVAKTKRVGKANGIWFSFARNEKR